MNVMERESTHRDPEEVLERLLLAHQGFFDVERGHEFAGKRFEGYGEFHSSASKYVLVKRAKLWEANSHEYLFIKVLRHLDAQSLSDLVAYMKEQAIAKVSLERDHMNSFLSLVIIAHSMEEELEQQIKGVRFRKNFMLGLKGWADLRLCVIDLAKEEVYSNSMGKELVPTLRANAFETSC